MQRRLTMGMVWSLAVVGVPIVAVAQTQTPAPSQQTDQRPGPAQQAPPKLVPLGVNGQLASWLQLRGEFPARASRGSRGAGLATATTPTGWIASG